MTGVPSILADFLAECDAHDIRLLLAGDGASPAMNSGPGGSNFPLQKGEHLGDCFVMCLDDQGLRSGVRHAPQH